MGRWGQVRPKSWLLRLQAGVGCEAKESLGVGRYLRQLQSFGEHAQYSYEQVHYRRINQAVIATQMPNGRSTRWNSLRGTSSRTFSHTLPKNRRDRLECSRGPKKNLSIGTFKDWCQTILGKIWRVNVQIGWAQKIEETMETAPVPHYQQRPCYLNLFKQIQNLRIHYFGQKKEFWEKGMHIGNPY